MLSDSTTRDFMKQPRVKNLLPMWWVHRQLKYFEMVAIAFIAKGGSGFLTVGFAAAGKRDGRTLVWSRRFMTRATEQYRCPS